jgi:hypothetical protein
MAKTPLRAPSTSPVLAREAERLKRGAPMSPAHFARVCEAWKGPCWQRAVAADLSRDERSIRRYAAGEQPVPDELRELLRRHLDQHASLLVKLVRTLERD